MGTRTWRISSVAYAVDEMASDAKIARAKTLSRRRSDSSAEASGRPTTSRLRIEAMAAQSPWVAWSSTSGGEAPTRRSRRSCAGGQEAEAEGGLRRPPPSERLAGRKLEPT